MIKISCDSTADLNALFVERGVSVLPLAVVLGGKSYDDGVDIMPEDIYKFVDENKVLPKTAARSRQEHLEFFQSVLTSPDDILIHFTISGEISVTATNAKAAAEELNGRVFVIDGRSLSTGTGLLVLYACDLRDEGKCTAEEIVERVTARIPAVEASFFVETMDYLHKGGRCSGLTSFVATALKLKPSLLLKDGKILVGQKYRGKGVAIAEKYVDNIFDMYNTPDLTRIFVTYTAGTDPEVISLVRGAVEKRGGFKCIHETVASSTITCHCGKGTIGILFINDGNEQ